MYVCVCNVMCVLHVRNVIANVNVNVDVHVMAWHVNINAIAFAIVNVL